MKKVLLTWANWMLAHDFKKYNSDKFDIFWYDKENLDITNLDNIEKVVSEIKPDIILNCAAYTQVDNAEDIWNLLNYQINTLWVYNLAKISNKYWASFITISTDYVFDWKKETWYKENDVCNPINQYWMSKYLWEELTKKENKNSVIIRTSWLYWGWIQFKNFVNTMIKLAETKTELKVVNDQLWIPTYTKDLSFAICDVISDIERHKWKILHFSNSCQDNWISWFDFAGEIFKLKWKLIKLVPCSSTEFITKAKRPEFSILSNNSGVRLRDWKEGLLDYLSNL